MNYSNIAEFEIYEFLGGTLDQTTKEVYLVLLFLVITGLSCDCWFKPSRYVSGPCFDSDIEPDQHKNFVLRSPTNCRRL